MRIIPYSLNIYARSHVLVPNLLIFEAQMWGDSMLLERGD